MFVLCNIIDRYALIFTLQILSLLSTYLYSIWKVREEGDLQRNMSLWKSTCRSELLEAHL